MDTTRKTVSFAGMPATARKPHADWAGYRSERRNPLTGGHNVIVDCKLAEQQGAPWVDDYAEEGGRYMVLCNTHSANVFVTSMPTAMECMKDATTFCDDCREIELLKRKDLASCVNL